MSNSGSSGMSVQGMRLWALRGAAQAEANERDAILSASTDLIRELIDRNDLVPDQMVSCIFTCTDDINAEFPAVAARSLGLSRVPLICSRELNVPGSMQRVIRVLLHYYAPHDHVPAHVYLGETRKLRTDLHGAQ